MIPLGVPDYTIIAARVKPASEGGQKGAANGIAELDADGKVPDAQIPSAIARDSEVTAAVAAHVAEADPHAQYQRESEKGAPNGYASLGSDGKVPSGELPAWTADEMADLTFDQASNTETAKVMAGGDRGEFLFIRTALTPAVAQAAEIRLFRETAVGSGTYSARMWAGRPANGGFLDGCLTDFVPTGRRWYLKRTANAGVSESASYSKERI